LFRILRIAVEQIYNLEERLLFRSGQRAEYYADRLAAQVASSTAMIESLDILYLDQPCSLAVRYAAQREEPDVWAAQLRFKDDLPAKEWERLRRLDAKRGAGIDATHPPTNLRIELLKSESQHPARIELAGAESVAISQEMASGFGLVGERIASRFAG